ncbi:unnamed protein product [Didymodactylos carnosus]|uniref:Eukaryotic translation initiation factor 3 subunit A n=1 Tax=Didymodactylos carnosus TaxID=1234261 RepID=A0A813YEH1_9BILA|nr:unnamed protein product [Didymodactylos carnosus]CAF0883120.1 unnamed protein product [Didymodactylos carnosus]CAF3535567.1 unnamed protein product [Didymodactylos carnosus]CAF3668915.1 unnamed protein product [Didymodactylos carnosus]
MVFMKPESALKRADEFIEVGKKQRALESLLEVVKSRRHRTWTKTHEPLMEKLLELCVELRKSQVAKDGLHQYKTISQAVSVKSLEDVIMKFLRNGEQRCMNARQAAQSAVVDIDDLEVLQTPESLLLSAVCGESQQDRADRDLLAPWLKFVWESYKQCLDLLKNNNRVEKIYQDVAQMGFKFCQLYNRRPEFRKLCDTIRTHFVQSQKYSQQMYSVNFQLPETQTLHLETRLVQLDTAIAMELWQEAFKAVEDIHSLTTISKKTPKPQQLAMYYNKVALVFWKAGNYVFHATTVLKLYVLHKEQKKNITTAELTKLSTKALLSILSIPLPTPRTQIDEHLETEDTLNEKQKRLTGLLTLQTIPTRASLIKDMIKNGILQFVYPELKDLYEWLEVEFHPLRLSSKVEKCIEFVEKLNQPEYSQYMPALRDVTVVRLLQQVSQVYQTIELKRFISLAPPIDKFRLEKIIVDSARNNDVQVRINHKLQSLSFGTDLTASTTSSSSLRGHQQQQLDLAQVESGPNVQKMPNEQIRNQLIAISRALHWAKELVDEKASKEKRDKLRREIAQTYYRDEQELRKEILKRRELIERFKETKEKTNQDRIRLADDARKRAMVQAVLDDKHRTAVELKAIKDKEDEELKDKQHRQLMKMAIDKLRDSEIGRKIIKLLTEAELYKYDPASLNALHIEHVIKDSREQKEKLKQQHRKVDYFVRACHEEEVKLLSIKSEDDITVRRDIFNREREKAHERRKRLTRMDEDKNEFLSSIKDRRHDDYLSQMKAFHQRLQRAKEIKLEELRKENKEKKQQDWIKRKELDEERKQREKQQQIQEDKERIERDRREKERLLESDRRKQLDSIALKQREKEEAIERKLKKQEQSLREERNEVTRDSGGGSVASQPWRPTRIRPAEQPGTEKQQPPADNTDSGGPRKDGAGNWRTREIKRMDSWRHSESGSNNEENEYRDVKPEDDVDERTPPLSKIREHRDDPPSRSYRQQRPNAPRSDVSPPSSHYQDSSSRSNYRAPQRPGDGSPPRQHQGSGGTRSFGGDNYRRTGEQQEFSGRRTDNRRAEADTKWGRDQPPQQPRPQYHDEHDDRDRDRDRDRFSSNRRGGGGGFSNRDNFGRDNRDNNRDHPVRGDNSRDFNRDTRPYSHHDDQRENRGPPQSRNMGSGSGRSEIESSNWRAKAAPATTPPKRDANKRNDEPRESGRGEVEEDGWNMSLTCLIRKSLSIQLLTKRFGSTINLKTTTKTSDDDSQEGLNSSSKTKVKFDMKMRQKIERSSFLSFLTEDLVCKVEKTVELADRIQEVNVDNFEPLFTLMENEPCPLRADNVNNEKTLSVKQVQMNASVVYEDYLVAPMIGIRESQTVEKLNESQL